MGHCMNLIRIQRKVRGVLETQDLVSPWETTGVMTVESSSSANSHALHAVSDTSTVLVLEFFHAKNARAADDPLRLAGKAGFSSTLQVSTVCHFNLSS